MSLQDPSPLELSRRRLRASRSRRSTLTALASTLVFAVVLYLVITNAPGWPRTQQTFFNPQVAWDSLPKVLEGLWLNIRVLAVAAVCTLALALVVAVLRTLRGPVWLPLRLLATGFVDLFRGIPLIVLLYLIGFGVPALRFTDSRIDPVILGTVALVLTYAAYVSEVFRAGIDSVHPSQRLGARSLGLSYGQSMKLVVLPQAVRRVTPPLLNDFVAMQKDVGLISLLGPLDAVRAAQISSQSAFNFTPYVVAALLFVLLSVPTARLADWASARAARREQSGAAL
ncbi:amino acid ABC transporter permease [Ornithinicoccus hortensis]|uniref:Amino acid ABC transporter membrane protein (PAAT family) n=1 Tax=Ornithinicoccus hortensis TaxID=82346 RepID=A0A542YML3_9MICO|nr:amino acid ABC transporter permease [Ornithinicoccus hortensis]TQL49326.1 amino acid ABC transporter membrane protein (PAAT family) [Ornithinicoccus hortensis]